VENFVPFAMTMFRSSVQTISTFNLPAVYGFEYSPPSKSVLELVANLNALFFNKIDHFV